MIRINLLKSLPSSNPTVLAALARNKEGTIITRREAAIAIVLLAAGAGALFYLASRPSGPSAPFDAATVPGPAPEAPKPQEAPPRAADTERQLAAAPAPPPADTTAASECSVTEMVIGRQPGALAVTLQTGAEATYRSFELKVPPRIVVDLPNCRLGLPGHQHSQAVAHPLVQRIRASQFQLDPPIFRIVLDVTSMPRYQARSVPGGLEIRVLDGGL